MTLNDAQQEIRANVGAALSRPHASNQEAVAALGLHPGLRILDAGCGPGLHLGLFRDAVAPGGTVTGIDLDADSVAVAADLWAAEIAAGSIRVEAGDVTALPFAADSFDLAWTSFVLHHVPDPEAALRELVRVVAPGGRIAAHDADVGISFPAAPWPPELENRLRAAVFRAARDGYGGTLPYHYDPFFARHLPGLLRAAGLRDVTLRAIPAVQLGPLPSDEATELRSWFREWFDGRLRPYLAPRDHVALHALFDPDNPADLLADPGFFLSRTWLLATGTVTSD